MATSQWQHWRAGAWRDLPGSGRMVGGPLRCRHVALPPSHPDLYVHMAHPQPHEQVRDACPPSAVMAALTAAARQLDGAHGDGHPLPGVFTVELPGYRVDLRRYGGRAALWAEVYRQPPQLAGVLLLRHDQGVALLAYLVAAGCARVVPYSGSGLMNYVVLDRLGLRARHPGAATAVEALARPLVRVRDMAGNEFEYLWGPACDGGPSPWGAGSLSVNLHYIAANLP